MVGGTGVLLTLAADEGAVLDAGDVVDIGAVQHTARQLVLIEGNQLAGTERFLPERIGLLVAAVNP